MAIWEWMLEAYAQPGVAQSCETLQDRHGQSPPFLLWAVWAETSDADLLARAADLTRQWDALVIVPLRSMRRDLKAAMSPIEDKAREALRDEVKAVELNAERLLIETLHGLAPHQAGAHALAALEAASAAWGRPAPADALAALAGALG